MQTNLKFFYNANKFENFLIWKQIWKCSNMQKNLKFSNMQTNLKIFYCVQTNLKIFQREAWCVGQNRDLVR